MTSVDSASPAWLKMAVAGLSLTSCIGLMRQPAPLVQTGSPWPLDAIVPLPVWDQGLPAAAASSRLPPLLAPSVSNREVLPRTSRRRRAPASVPALPCSLACSKAAEVPGTTRASQLAQGETSLTVNPSVRLRKLASVGPDAARAAGITWVVAHYDENLDWLAGYEDQAMVYSKGGLPPRMGVRSWVQLPNIGREAHTMLYHIVHNYHSLTAITVFTQGRIEDSIENFQGMTSFVDQIVADKNRNMMAIQGPGLFSDWERIPHYGKWASEIAEGSLRQSPMNPKQFWQWMFHGAPPPENVEWSWRAVFGVHRRAIHRHPLAFYKRLLHRFEAQHHPNPEEAHFMERFWMAIFDWDFDRPLGRHGLN